MLIPFSSQVLGDHGGDTDAIILYAVNLVGVSHVAQFLWLALFIDPVGCRVARRRRR